MTISNEEHAEIALSRERAMVETSDERFDRVAFAERALAMMRPERTTVAICGGARQLRVESGRQWGRAGARWAILAIPPAASRRAIALAIAEIARVDRAWVYDVLMSDVPFR
jgi:hypothetical protein